MSLQELIDELRAKNSPTAKDLERLEAMVTEYPECAELWNCYGDMIQLSDGEYPVGQALDCYRRSIEADSSFAEGYESIGYFLDVYNDDFAGAAEHFRRAIQLGAGDDSWIGLARVLAQMGQANEGLELLKSCQEPVSPGVAKVRKEIADGDWDPV
jgi:hypothetical protein